MNETAEELFERVMGILSDELAIAHHGVPLGNRPIRVDAIHRIMSRIKGHIEVQYYCSPCKNLSATSFEAEDYRPDVFCPKCMKQMKRSVVE